MPYLFCKNIVTDFDQWKAVFDSHAVAQWEAGLRIKHVWRGVDDPCEVFMLFEVTDLAKARAFVTAPEVPDAQQESGMVEPPVMYFME